ncbi:unnamed protein product [Prunus armeniaca]
MDAENPRWERSPPGKDVGGGDLQILKISNSVWTGDCIVIPISEPGPTRIRGEFGRQPPDRSEDGRIPRKFLEHPQWKGV